MEFKLRHTQLPDGECRWEYGTEYTSIILGHTKPTKRQMRMIRAHALFVLPTFHTAYANSQLNK